MDRQGQERAQDKGKLAAASALICIQPGGKTQAPVSLLWHQVPRVVEVQVKGLWFEGGRIPVKIIKATHSSPVQGALPVLSDSAPTTTL